MRKTILYVAMSLDGYIADQNGGVSWLMGDGSDPESLGTYPAFYDSIDTILLGYTTYHQIITVLSPDKWVYEGKRCYVLTSKAVASHDDIVFTSEEIVALVETLKAEKGKDIWVCGGAALAQNMITKDLIDEYRISIVPVLLGGGMSLFGTTRKELKLCTSSQCNGITELRYLNR